MFYSEFCHYSPVYDCDVIRISVPDEHNQEYFMIVKDSGDGKKLREAKETALDAIVTAIQNGAAPGEVYVQ